MTATAATLAEAEQIAAEFRSIFAGCDWVVTIRGPLFAGDRYMIVVG